MTISVNVIDSCSIESTGTAYDAVDLIAFVEEKLGQIRAVLAGDSSDQCTLLLSGRSSRHFSVSKEEILRRNRI